MKLLLFDGPNEYFQIKYSIAEYLNNLEEWDVFWVREIIDQDLDELCKPYDLVFYFPHPRMNHNFSRRLGCVNIKKWIYIDDLHPEKPRRSRIYALYDGFVVTYQYVFGRFFPKLDIGKTLWFPHFVPDGYIVGFNENPLNRILLSGSQVGRVYPMRCLVAGMRKDYLIDILRNPGYKRAKHKVLGKKYIEHLNKYLVAFTCCANEWTPYIVSKFFEIPASGALLLAYDEYVKEFLGKLGFVDGQHYVSVRKDNLEEKIKYVLDLKNRGEINRIRRAGYDLVREKHLLSHRIAELNENLSLS